ncbi:M20/M25/M40 family metallo-hydrolase [Bacillus carboniphilus]|uniref:M20/M25/M40 family metallo-hydrolase n=1 Tax=Bacillus carboniphilus TaxID=86663 RepID=A0ABP3FY62_9BACI
MVQVDNNFVSIFNRLLENEDVIRGLDYLKKDHDHTTKEQIELTAISAPTFQEEVRGEAYKKKLLELGIEDIQTDEVGNVFGIRKGSGTGPRLVLCAHLDTVFPEGTDTIHKEVDGKIYAPGIADDGRGLAAVLTIVRALNAANIQTEGDLIVGATVGEEGLGDLRGVKALFENRNDMDGFISIEPGNPAGVIYLATGSARYNVTYQGPGGHSFGAFGTPSAVHALGRAIAMLADMETPKEPKTTFNVGTVTGGTTVNTIAARANMVIDLRSTSQEELALLEDRALAIIKKAADDENNRWGQDAIKVDIELVGNRPAGSQSEESAIVKSSLAAAQVLGFSPVLEQPSSTDSNVPISLGVPAVTLGGGGKFGGIHTKEEYFDPTDAYYGPQKILLTILGLIGVAGVSKPLLEKR